MQFWEFTSQPTPPFSHEWVGEKTVPFSPRRLARIMTRNPRVSVLSGIATGGVCLAALLGPRSSSRAATDLAVVSLLAERQTDVVNTWGGNWSVGHAQQGVTLRLCDLQGGHRGLHIDLGRVEAGDTRYLQCFASGFGRKDDYYQTRDLSRYERLQFHVKNSSGVAIHGRLQVKDYRDSKNHAATYQYEIPEHAEWTAVNVPLKLADSGWKVDGSPDFGRVLTVDFLFELSRAIAAGQLIVADVALVEPGGPLSVETSSVPALAERVARRQWECLWAARNRDHGLMPNNSYQATDAALNTTAAMFWMLPAAVRHHWIEQAEANAYAELLVGTIDRVLDRSVHLPARYVDWVTLEPSLLPEESSVDAAFLALALYQYESLSSTPPKLKESLGRTRNRFDFASFASQKGWRMAYRRASRWGPEGFIECTYDAYTNEGNLVSLAAHLGRDRSVPIDAYWSLGTQRVRAGLMAYHDSPIVHPMAEYRAPFTQALWNLFVDVRQRGVDAYPDPELAANPWQNFVCYERNVMSKLAEMGRPCLVQPDAGDDGTLECYRQFSPYDCGGQDDLFMPWSASLMLLSGVERADTAFRFVLEHRLFDCMGLADSARWTTGKTAPESVTARHDFWNTCLSTMALLEWLDGPERLSRSFAALPEVRGALDRVFPAAIADRSGELRAAIAPATPTRKPRGGVSLRTVGASASPAGRL